MQHDQTLDAVGLLCPLPVLKAAKRLRGMEKGQVLQLIVDDPAAVVDVPHYCSESGNKLLESTTNGAVQTYFIART